jgi:iron complex transport system substrate-binding protein
VTPSRPLPRTSSEHSVEHSVDSPARRGFARRSLLGIAPSAAVLAALTACGAGSQSTGDAASDSDPSDGGSAAGGTQGAPSDLPKGWTWVEGTDLPSTTATPKLPVTVTDGTGEKVEVKDISKIIVGGEDVADILAALGLQKNIYAAPTNSVAQAALDAPEHFEFSQKTGVEGLLSVKGTLFIGNNVKRHGKPAAQFRDAGVDAVVVDDQQPIADKIRAVAEYVGAKDAGEELASAVEDQLDQATSDAKGTGIDALRILVVTASGAGGANAVVGTGTAAADIIEAAGATSVGVEEGLRGYSVKYSDEGLLDTKPDVILTGDGDLEEWGGLEGFLSAFPTLAQTPAGTSNTFFLMPSEQIKVSGVGVGAGAIALVKALAAVAK